MAGEERKRSLYDLYGEGGIGWALEILRTEGHLDPEDLALTIETNPDEPLPNELRTYLVRYLRGEVKKKTGPKPDPLALFWSFERMLAAMYYKRALRIFQKLHERQRKRLKPGDIPPRAEPTPQERALDWVQMRKGVFRNVNARTLANIITQENNTRRSRSRRFKP